MSVKISLENLSRDLAHAQNSGDFLVCDFLEADGSSESWLRANNLAQLAINPARFINQQPPLGSLSFGGKIIIPPKMTDTPPAMVHFGSEVTANAAIGMVGLDADDYSHDVHFHQRVDASRLGESALAELLDAHDINDTPVALLSLADAYDGAWKYEEAQQLYFAHTLSQIFPDHREILLPNTVAILSEHSQEELRDYFQIGRVAWRSIIATNGNDIDFRYKV